MPIPANNWKSHFRKHSNNDTNNNTIEDLFHIFSTQPPSGCLSSSVEEQETIFLALAPISSHIQFLLHFTKLGGTGTSPTTKHFALSGFGPVAFPTQVNSSLFEKTDHKVPSWTAFTAITDAAAVPSLIAHGNSTAYQFRTCIPIPPSSPRAPWIQEARQPPSLPPQPSSASGPTTRKTKPPRTMCGQIPTAGQFWAGSGSPPPRNFHPSLLFPPSIPK